MKKFSKKESETKMNDFFKEIKSKTPKEILKMKKLTMSQNIPLKELRKKFCKKCLAPYSGNEKIRIKDKIKTITCKKCEYIARWKI